MSLSLMKFCNIPLVNLCESKMEKLIWDINILSCIALLKNCVTFFNFYIYWSTMKKILNSGRVA